MSVCWWSADVAAFIENYGVTLAQLDSRQDAHYLTMTHTISTTQDDQEREREREREREGGREGGRERERGSERC